MSAAQPPLTVAAPLRLRRAHRATCAQFAVLGTLAGAWGAHVPSVKQRYALDEGQLAIVLLCAALGAVCSLFFAGRAVARLGARRAAFVAGLVMCAMLALVLVAPGRAALLTVAGLFGAGMSLFDVAINSEGSELEHLSGRAVMSTLHGMFSVGGMAGAALVALLLRMNVPSALQLMLVAGSLVAVVAIAERGMLDTRGSHDEDRAHFAWPRGRLLVIGLLILAGMIAEGVMYDWCVLYLAQELHMPQAHAALGYSAFAGALALARFGGDALRERFEEGALLFSGALLAALAMAAVLLAGTPWVALPGFALVGAGLAPVAPILFNAATRVPGVSRAAAIASVTSIGYSGFMIGPPLIGGLARASSLTAALAVVVVAAALLAIGARQVPKAAER